MKIYKLIIVCGCIVLSGCASQTNIPHKLTNNIKCDNYSKLGFGYNRKKQPKEIASLRLQIPEKNGALSKLQFTGQNNKIKDFDSKVIVANTKYGASLSNGPFPGKYKVLLIPPKIAFKYFSQSDFTDKAIPLFLAIPEQSFQKGKCYAHQQPFVIASNKQLKDPGVAQLVMPYSELKRVVSHLFLDKELQLQDYIANEKADNVDILSSVSINAMIQDMSQKAVDLNTWGGYITLELERKDRGFWDWLFQTTYGKTSENMTGVINSYSYYETPPLDELINEYDEMENQWNMVLKEYSDKLKNWYKLVAHTKSVLDNPKKYIPAFNKAQSMMGVMQSYINLQTISLQSQLGFFVTDEEVSYYTNKLNHYYNLGVNEFHSISSAYADSLIIKDGKINVSKILNPISTVAKPIAWDGLRFPLKDLGANIFAKGNAYIIKKSGSNSIIEINLLLDLNTTVNSLKGYINQEVRSNGSCEIVIQGINQAGPFIDGKKVVTNYSAPILLRVCGSFDYPCFKGWKWYSCRKHFKTNVGRTSANLSSFATIVNVLSKDKTNSYPDVAIDYGYRGYVSIFPIIGKRGRTDGILYDLKKGGKFNDFFKLKPSLNTSALGAGNVDGHKYFWLSLRTDEITDDFSIIVLNNIKKSLGSYVKD